jgi:hypothetical protein
MKRLILFACVIGLATAMLMIGCEKEENDPGNPSINFIVEQGYISSDATLNVNAEFKVKVGVFKNNESNSDLQTLTVGRTFTPASRADWDTTFNIDGDNQQIEITFTAYNTAGSELIELTVTDKNNKSDMVSLTITTALPEVRSYPNNDLGSYNEPTIGSFFSTKIGAVLPKNDAFSIQEKVDFGFFLGANNGSTFASPANPTLQEVFELNEAGWTTFNETMFISPAPIDAAAFDAIADGYIFPDFDDASAKSYANQLSNNDVVFFKTVDDKLGFIKVNSINSKGDKINIDVKVEL